MVANRDYFRVLVVDLKREKSEVKRLEGRREFVGGSGLCALLFERYGLKNAPWHNENQPLIFAIGPLTGLFPLMSKTICAFKSPYHDQYTESHAGGRSALSLFFANLDALVIKEQARRPSLLVVGSRRVEIRDASYLWGLDVIKTGKIVRRLVGEASGHRSILRIGPSGENLCSFSCINCDTYRHFGRLGAGAVMGKKNLKAIAILGDERAFFPPGKNYKKVYGKIFKRIEDSGMMKKYHDLGTPANFKKLNELRSLPWRNLSATWDKDVDRISGETFAEGHLLRNLACSGCPIGCIHLGYIREKFMKDHRYYFEQVAYDYEPVFATGSMLGITDPVKVLKLILEIDAKGLDVISTGVALAWAAEAMEKGLISREETICDLKFGDAQGFLEAVGHLSNQETEFYRHLSRGTLAAARIYGGEDFACVLGQEMAGYATGELYFTAQALGFRHSHLDVGAYSYEQKHDERDVKRAVDFLIKDEPRRALLNSMVSCLFARGVYTNEYLAMCLESVGLKDIAINLDELSERIRFYRWKLRFDTGFSPEDIKIPRRFYKVESWKGKVNPKFLDELKISYGKRLKGLVSEGEKKWT